MLAFLLTESGIGNNPGIITVGGGTMNNHSILLLVHISISRQNTPFLIGF
jgi:hypothetical protein